MKIFSFLRSLVGSSPCHDLTIRTTGTVSSTTTTGGTSGMEDLIRHSDMVARRDRDDDNHDSPSTLPGPSPKPAFGLNKPDVADNGPTGGASFVNSSSIAGMGEVAPLANDSRDSDDDGWTTVANKRSSSTHHFACAANRRPQRGHEDNRRSRYNREIRPGNRYAVLGTDMPDTGSATSPSMPPQGRNHVRRAARGQVPARRTFNAETMTLHELSEVIRGEIPEEINHNFLESDCARENFRSAATMALAAHVISFLETMRALRLPNQVLAYLGPSQYGRLFHEDANPTAIAIALQQQIQADTIRSLHDHRAVARGHAFRHLALQNTMIDLDPDLLDLDILMAPDPTGNHHHHGPTRRNQDPTNSQLTSNNRSHRIESHTEYRNPQRLSRHRRNRAPNRARPTSRQNERVSDVHSSRPIRMPRSSYFHGRRVSGPHYAAMVTARTSSSDSDHEHPTESPAGSSEEHTGATNVPPQHDAPPVKPIHENSDGEATEEETDDRATAEPEDTEREDTTGETTTTTTVRFTPTVISPSQRDPSQVIPESLIPEPCCHVGRRAGGSWHVVEEH